jgi:osmotically-inducible protein OsmY
MNIPKITRLRAVPGYLVLSGLAVGLFACRGNATPPEPNASAPTASAAEAKPSTPSDQDIAQAIGRHFEDEGLLRAQHVKATVTQGIATISGSVDNLLASERARDVTESIKGVRSVVDQVIVTPVARTDDEIKKDVARALHDDAATRPYTIGIAAKDGKVTLSGTADSWQQKNLFADVAETVPGVKSLENAVSVHYSATRPDSEILADVDNRISNDVWIDDDLLHVTVAGHVVHMHGSVASVGQKERARSDGYVAGVDAVDDEGVVVDWSAKHDQRSLVDFTQKPDAHVLQAVRDVFQLDPRLKVLVPQVAVHNGAVVLL